MALSMAAVYALLTLVILVMLAFPAIATISFLRGRGKGPSPDPEPATATATCPPRRSSFTWPGAAEATVEGDVASVAVAPAPSARSSSPGWTAAGVVAGWAASSAPGAATKNNNNGGGGGSSMAASAASGPRATGRLAMTAVEPGERFCHGYGDPFVGDDEDEGEGSDGGLELPEPKDLADQEGVTSRPQEGKVSGEVKEARRVMIMHLTRDDVDFPSDVSGGPRGRSLTAKFGRRS